MISQYPFGRTGHHSTRIIFGGAAFWSATQDEADRTLDVLLEYGINHIDTAASYGESELRIGPWMRQHRDTFFLATKTAERTYQKARDEFHRSLERLRVGSVDLLQLHHLVGQEEWDVAMGPGGVVEMAIEARQQGLLRFIGVTGHEVAIPAMHLKSLQHFDFDSVLLPYNFVIMQNPQYAADFEALIALCKERNVAVQTIKSVTRRPWGEHHKTHNTWYAPVSEQGDIDLTVHWVLGREGFYLNMPADIHLLPKVLDAASRFTTRPSDADIQAMVKRLEMEPLFT